MKLPHPDLEELFFAALEIENPAARAAFLRRHAGDEQVQRQIEELLAARRPGERLPRITAPGESVG